MSVPTLDELLTVRTQDEWTAIALAALQGRNFPTTDWTSTGPERAMLETSTACDADQSLQIPLIVQLVLVQAALQNTAPTDPATPALQFLAYNFYQLTATAAVATIGDATLTCNANSGPYTIAIGQLLATDGAGNTYTNLDGGTLNTSDTLDLSWQCSAVGTAGNAAINTIVTLLTPLPGVSINNPGTTFTEVTHTGSGTGTVTPSGATPVAHDWIIRIDTSGAAGAATSSYSTNGGASFTSAGAAAAYTPAGSGTTITLAGNFVAGDRYTFSAPGTWITTQGRDLESQGSLAARIIARWPALGSVPVADKYELWTREADANVARVAIFTAPAVAATVAVYIAGVSSVNTAADQNQVQDYLDVRAGLTDIPEVHLAGSTSVTIAGTATYPSGSTTIPTTRDAAIDAYINQAPIGSVLKVSEVIALAMNLDAAGNPQGALNITGVTLNGGGDVTLGSTNVAAVTNNIAWVGV